MTALARLRTYMELVRFSHTLFALPFAVMALFLATPGEWPRPWTAALILVCMVAARTAAMAYNRLADRDIDALNPRTRSRHLPARLVGVGEVAGVVAVSGLVFVGAAWLLNPLAFGLSFPVLGILLAYSHMKRLTAMTHFVLGLSLGLAPLGVWIAVRGTIDASLATPAGLGLAVLLWVSGFDILYACQDLDFDRAHGLHSVPARVGVGRALWIARVLHVGMIVLLVLTGMHAGLGLAYHVGVGLAASLLVHEHRLVRRDDLSRIDVAFFTVNGWISILLCVFTVGSALW